MPHEDAVLGQPTGVIDVVEAVRPTQTGAEVLEMADPALDYFPGVALELGGGDIVVGVDFGRPFGMGLPWQDSQAMPPWVWLKRKSWPGFSAKRWLAAISGVAAGSLGS